MATKTPAIDCIESLTQDNIMVVCDDETSAKTCLKRNPYCQVQHESDGRVVLIYNKAQTNLLNAIKRA